MNSIATISPQVIGQNRPFPNEDIVTFLAARRAETNAKLRGMCGFPMRALGRRDIVALCYEKSVRERFEQFESNLFALSVDPDAYRGLPEREQDEALYCLFILGDSLDTMAVADAMGQDWLNAALDCGLLWHTDSMAVACPFRLVPHDQQLFLSDRYSIAQDMVYLSNDSLFMAKFTKRIVKRHVNLDHLVDLGCGSGILGIAAASALEIPVAGVDLNERAIVFARANARINNVESRWLPGSYEAMPLRPGCFVVANPPFVFSPASGALHSDGGNLGLGLTRQLLRMFEEQLPNHSSFALMTQSPIIGNEILPRLISDCRDSFPKLDLLAENVGTMPVLSKFADFYRKNGVTGFQQLVLSGNRGHGDVTYLSENKHADDVCFG